MVDLKMDVPATEAVQVDSVTLEAIHRGMADADAEFTVSLDEARARIPLWVSKFESEKPR